MSFVAITDAEIVQDKPVDNPLLSKVQDNFDDLNSRLSAVATIIVPNGSFEIDTDADGIPDGWTRNLYPGGSSALDSTKSASGLKSFKFIHPGGAGNGGGYLTSDYIECSPNMPVVLSFEIESEIAGLHNRVDLEWFTSAKVSISTTTIYDDLETNPTSFKRFLRGSLAPATGKYCKIIIRGGMTDKDTGTAKAVWFDNLQFVSIAPNWAEAGVVAEQSTTSTTFVDIGSFDIRIPSFENVSFAGNQIVLEMYADIKTTNVSYSITARFRYSTTYSNEVSTTSITYSKNKFTLTLPAALSGTITIVMQLKRDSTNPTAWGRKPDPLVVVKPVYA